MVSERNTSYLWATAHYLIKERGYKLIQLQSDKANTDLSQQNQVLHLLKKIGSDLRYIRLALADFVWSSVVERNVKESAATAELFRKKFNGKKIEGLNLYFFPETPMTDIMSRVDQFGRVRIGQTTFLQSVCIDLENGLPLNPIVDYAAFQFSNEELVQLLAHDPQDSATYMQDLMQIEEQRQKEVRSFFSNSKPFWTYIFIGINVLMWILLELSGGSTDTRTLLDYGAKQSLLIAIDGEWWRLFTSMFLHIGIMHLAFNSIALYYLGLTVERMFGHGRFLLLYVVAGLVGSIASFAFGDPLGSSAGASGAIYGLFGALLYFGLRRRDLFFQTMGRDILMILGINLALSVAVSSIDLFAHLGGLAGGFFAAMMVGLPQFGREYSKRMAAVVIVVILFIIGAAIGIERANDAYEIWQQFLEQQINK